MQRKSYSFSRTKGEITNRASDEDTFLQNFPLLDSTVENKHLCEDEKIDWQFFSEWGIILMP